LLAARPPPECRKEEAEVEDSGEGEDLIRGEVVGSLGVMTVEIREDERSDKAGHQEKTEWLEDQIYGLRRCCKEHARNGDAEDRCCAQQSHQGGLEAPPDLCDEASRIG